MQVQGNLGTNDWYRMGKLITFVAGDLGLDLDSAEGGLNPNSGNVYLWSEDWRYSLFLGMGENRKVEVCVTNTENGDEYGFDAPTHLGTLEDEVEKIQAAMEAEDQETLDGYDRLT